MENATVYLCSKLTMGISFKIKLIFLISIAYLTFLYGKIQEKLPIPDTYYKELQIYCKEIFKLNNIL